MATPRTRATPASRPGGSSGGAGAAVAAGIGHIAHGTDIAGSIRYPAYACGVHGLRPTVGRIAAFNAALPERPIGPQIIGGIGSACAHHRRSQDCAGGDVGQGRARPLVGAGAAGRPGDAEARRAVSQSRWARSGGGSQSRRRRCRQAAGARGLGGRRDRDTPPLREAAELQTKLWLGDGYEAQLAAAEREGDPGALACLRGNRTKVFPFDVDTLSKALTRRATLTREWLQFFEKYAVLLMPVSGELPFPDELDLRDDASFARVWHAQLTQIAIPFMGLPG